MEEYPVTFQNRRYGTNAIRMGQSLVTLNFVLFKATIIHTAAYDTMKHHVLLCRPSTPVKALASVGLLVKEA